MKPKYQKPTLTCFPISHARAQDDGFEPLGTCGPGSNVGGYVGPGCGPGNFAGTQTCSTGSGNPYGEEWQFCAPGGAPTAGYTTTCWTGTGPTNEFV